MHGLGVYRVWGRKVISLGWSWRAEAFPGSTGIRGISALGFRGAVKHSTGSKSSNIGRNSNSTSTSANNGGDSSNSNHDSNNKNTASKQAV